MPVRTIFIFLFFYNSALLLAQGPVISAEELNVLYVGLENPIKIAIPGVLANQTVIKSSQGTVVNKNGVYHILIPERNANEAVISIGKITRKDTEWVYTKTFKIRNVPKAVPRLGFLNFDMAVPISALRVQQTMLAVIENFVYDEVKVTVTGYTAHFFSSSFGYQIVHSNSASLAPIKENLSKIKPTDLLIFDSIVMVGPNGKTISQKPYVVQFLKENKKDKNLQVSIYKNDDSINLTDNPEVIREFGKDLMLIITDPTNKSVLTVNFLDNNIVRFIKYQNNRLFSYTYSKDSTLTITESDTISSGKAYPISQLLVDTSTKFSEFTLKRTPQLWFINHHYNCTPYLPTGFWKTTVNDTIIAQGKIGLFCYVYDDMSGSDLVILPPYENEIVFKHSFEIGEDKPMRTFCWYLKPEKGFKSPDLRN